VRRLWTGVVLLAALVVLALVFARDGATGPTVRNRGGDGLRAAFRYLDERGWPVTAWERPLSELPLEPGLLVLTEPVTSPFDHTDQDALRRWLLAGGDVVVLPTGHQPGAFDDSLEEALDFSITRKLPELPRRLRDLPAWAATTVEATPPADAPWALEGVELSRPWWRVAAQPGDEVLLQDAGGDALARLRQRHNGKVLLLDTVDPWTNGRIGSAGNLAFLETAVARLHGERGVTFDEWHLGWRASTEAERAQAVVVPFDLLVSHLVLVWLAGLWALGRRFGPPVVDLPIPRGSVDRDLRVLAALHRKSGHAAQAGTRLLRSARQASRRRPDLPETFEGGSNELLQLARQVGEMQRDHLL